MSVALSYMMKLEIDVMQSNELTDASTFAAKFKLPAIVVHPGLASDAHIIRGKLNGRYKIITPIDWPKGEQFGMLKMRGLNTDAIEADGFEILLTQHKDEIETRNEASALTNFIRTHINKQAEIRFVIGSINKNVEEIQKTAKGLTKIPVPSYVRNDIHAKTQQSKANIDIHNTVLKAISESIGVPIKISGNIVDVRTLTAIDAARFGVNLVQAKALLKESTTTDTSK